MTGAYLSLYSEDRPELERGKGAERMCSCPSPAHEDRKPSCSVQLESGKWFCHGCGEGGGVVKWLRLTRGLSGPEALETVRELGLAPDSSRGRDKRLVNGSVRPLRTDTVLTASRVPSITLLRPRFRPATRPATATAPRTGPSTPGFTATPRTGPAARPTPTPAQYRRARGNLDPPGSAKPLALPRRNPD